MIQFLEKLARLAGCTAIVGQWHVDKHPDLLAKVEYTRPTLDADHSAEEAKEAEEDHLDAVEVLFHRKPRCTAKSCRVKYDFERNGSYDHTEIEVYLRRCEGVDHFGYSLYVWWGEPPDRFKLKSQWHSSQNPEETISAVQALLDGGWVAHRDKMRAEIDAETRPKPKKPVVEVTPVAPPRRRGRPRKNAV